VTRAAIAFNAMMEGLANAELRGSVLPLLPEGEEESAWRDALITVVRGFASRGRRTTAPVAPRRRARALSSSV
jgi:uncharacterized protein YgfB (UPF0149 family)